MRQKRDLDELPNTKNLGLLDSHLRIMRILSIVGSPLPKSVYRLSSHPYTWPRGGVKWFIPPPHPTHPPPPFPQQLSHPSENGKPTYNPFPEILTKTKTGHWTLDTKQYIYIYIFIFYLVNNLSYKRITEGYKKNIYLFFCNSGHNDYKYTRVILQ